MQQLAQIAIVVRDYDEAIHFYTQKLKFELLEDTPLTDIKRWVRVAPKGSQCGLLLAKAANEEQAGRIGDQPAAGSSFFCIPMISNMIMKTSLQTMLRLYESQLKSHGELWRSLQICMAICGILFSHDRYST